jgi:hypothetical protein
LSLKAISPSARHLVGEVPEVRLKDAEHVLHGAAGDADLLADDLFAVVVDAAVHHPQRDVIRILDSDLRPTLGERAQCSTRTQCGVELVSELLDLPSARRIVHA